MAKVEFDPAENSLTIDEKYHTIDVQVYPEDKKLEIRSSAKEDVFYSTDVYEYRILTNPVRFEMRLVESMNEPPPDQYEVKDGVVLESEIRKGKSLFFDVEKKIQDLKNQVQWNKIWESAFGNSIFFFVLSKHPEIISKEDYRKFLRQTSERIKNALHLMDEELKKKDTMGLQIQDGEWGKHIWYTNTKDLSDEELGKKREHSHKVFESFFKDEKSTYHGMSQSEFRDSTEILEIVDILLNQKESTAKVQQNKTSFGIKFGAFMLQWVWLFLVVSVGLWLLSLVVSIIEYSFVFALVISGILAFILIAIRSRQTN